MNNFQKNERLYKLLSIKLLGKGKIFLSQYLLWTVLLCLIVFFSIKEPSFLTLRNLNNILLHSSITGIMAIGMTFVIITGGIDLSVGAVAALTGLVAAKVALQEVGAVYPILVAALCGLVIGFIWNGIVIAYGKVAPFVVTLAGMTGFRGLGLIYSDAKPFFGLNNDFLNLGSGNFYGIPYTILFFVAIYIIAYIWQKKSITARYMYAIGDNLEAAKLSGVPVKKVLLFVYGFHGILVGISGAVLAARIGCGQPQVAVGYELIAIASVVIGGTSLLGGRGGVEITLIGIFILGVIGNGLNLMGYPFYSQQIVQGLIIVFAVLVDRLSIKKI